MESAENALTRTSRKRRKAQLKSTMKCAKEYAPRLNKSNRFALLQEISKSNRRLAETPSTCRFEVTQTELVISYP